MTDERQRQAQALMGRLGLEDANPPVPRHEPGRGSAVTPDEEFAIRLAYLGDGLSISKIAHRMGRTRETIRRVVMDPETDTLRKAIDAEKVDLARTKLRASLDLAADGWIEAIPVAAKKGDHRPMRDLLLHEKVVEPAGDRDGSGITVIVGGGGQVLVGLGQKLPLPSRDPGGGPDDNRQNYGGPS